MAEGPAQLDGRPRLGAARASAGSEHPAAWRPGVGVRPEESRAEGGVGTVRGGSL